MNGDRGSTDTTSGAAVMYLAAASALVTAILDLLSQWSPLSSKLFSEIRTANFQSVPLLIISRLEVLENTTGFSQLLGLSPGSSQIRWWLWPFFVSHYGALLFFPLALPGLSFLTRKSAFPNRLTRGIGYAAYISGIGYHLSMSFLAAALSASPPGTRHRIAMGFNEFMLPLAWMFTAGFILVSIMFFLGNLRLGVHLWPGAYVNPLLIFGGLMIASLVLPEGPRAALRIASFNVSLFLFYLLHAVRISSGRKKIS